jgi:Xaa-Pro dipeptidase
MRKGLIHFPGSPAVLTQGYYPTMTANQFVDDVALAAQYPAHIKALNSRHDRALEKAGAGHAIIFSGALRPVFLDDYYYPFKANPHFVSWLPLTTMPLCYLVHTPGEKPLLVYYQEKDYWHSPPIDPSGYWTAFFDIRVVHEFDHIAAQLPADRDQCIFIGEAHDDLHRMGVERVNPTTAMNILHFGRGSKTEYEVECMRQASRRGAAGHVAAEQTFRDRRSEMDIHLTYCRTVEQNENELPYGNIIALNQHGSVLHYQHQQRTAPDNPRSFLIDAGAQVHRYASDITRTYAFDDGEFSELVDGFNTLQLELVSEVKVGVDFADLHVQAHRKIAGFLTEHEFAQGSTDALLESGVTSAFFPHGLGHLLGVQVHDVGGFMGDENGNIIDRPSGHPFLRLTRILEENMVLTIEPGIYVIDMLLENLKGTPANAMVNFRQVERLRPYGGIRIEDNVRVLQGSCENLTRDAFASLD